MQLTLVITNNTDDDINLSVGQLLGNATKTFTISGEVVPTDIVDVATANPALISYTATLAFDISLPTADPHVVGALWANSGVVTVSAG